VKPPLWEDVREEAVSEFELLGKHAPDGVVAFGGAGTKLAAELLADAARISNALPVAFPGSHALLVLEQDRYAMAAALLGALDRGHAVALPPNSRRDSILAVHGRPETAIVIHDTDAGFPISISDLLAETGTHTSAGIDTHGAREMGRAPTPLVAPVVPHSGVIATVFTSGTTGPMTSWEKTSAELLGEADALGRAFEIEPGDRIVGTVAPGHIYGLLFTILLPLMRGAAFSRDTPHHAEAVARCVEDHHANVLVTVPVQLRSLDALAPGSLGPLRRVFSSTGPLPDSVAAGFYERHGLAVTEILGSTETGGIASRTRRAEGQEEWRPFPEVSVSVTDEGRLEVDSPFVHPDLPRPFETADLVELHDDGRFTHRGRADGIVKIGGRRVSIQEVDDVIRQQRGVDDVAVVAIPVDDGRGNQLLAAVAPATCDVAELKTALLKKFEPSCLPRRFLCVDAIPKEANGKTTRDRVLRLFGLQADGRPVNWKLDWGEAIRTREDNGTESLESTVGVPQDYAWFEGHFDEYAVLAGAAQLKDLILPMVAKAFPALGSVQSMRRIKFSGRIVPGDALTVRVSRGEEKTRVEFEIRKPSEVCARGILTLAENSTVESPR
jgi:acyl-coenzyme A synthetase/AMP-(fatty) acid ligase